MGGLDLGGAVALGVGVVLDAEEGERKRLREDGKERKSCAKPDRGAADSSKGGEGAGGRIHDLIAARASYDLVLKSINFGCTGTASLT